MRPSGARKSSGGMKAVNSAGVMWATNSRPEAVHGIGTSTPMSEPMRKSRALSCMETTAYLLPTGMQNWQVSPVSAASRRTSSCPLLHHGMGGEIVVGVEVDRAAEIDLRAVAGIFEDLGGEKEIDDLVDGRTRRLQPSRDLADRDRLPHGVQKLEDLDGSVETASAPGGQWAIRTERRRHSAVSWVRVEVLAGLATTPLPRCRFQE